MHAYHEHWCIFMVLYFEMHRLPWFKLFKQGVVTLVVLVEPFATGIKIFDWQNFALIA